MKLSKNNKKEAWVNKFKIKRKHDKPVTWRIKSELTRVNLSNLRSRSWDRDNLLEKKHKKSQSYKENKFKFFKKWCWFELAFKPVTRDIRPEALYLEKPRSSIPNQLNVERLTWKKAINYKKKKDPKQKITIKRIKIKIEIQNKFYFWLRGEIEKKN